MEPPSTLLARRQKINVLFFDHHHLGYRCCFLEVGTANDFTSQIWNSADGILSATYQQRKLAEEVLMIRVVKLVRNNSRNLIHSTEILLISAHHFIFIETERFIVNLHSNGKFQFNLSCCVNDPPFAVVACCGEYNHHQLIITSHNNNKQKILWIHTHLNHFQVLSNEINTITIFIFVEILIIAVNRR